MNKLNIKGGVRRIIACLDIKDGNVVKGVNFAGLKEAGNPLELAAFYEQQGADELVLLDISATTEKRKTAAVLAEITAEIRKIPVTAGGGITSVADAAVLLNAGAERITVSSAAVQSPGLLEELAGTFGPEKIVAAIDAKKYGDEFFVLIKGGTVKTALQAEEWAARCENLGAGEILLTSADADGMKTGFDLELTQRVCRSVQIPVIASGGAGNYAHFTELFKKTPASAALAAGVFHFGEVHIPELKNKLKKNRIIVP